MRRHRKDLAVVWVHRDDGAPLGGRSLELLLGCHLQVKVDGRDEIHSRLWLYAGDLALDMAATVDDDLSVAWPAAHIFVVILLKAALADDVAGVKAFVLKFRVFELRRTDLADVSDDVRQDRSQRIKSLRL